ncbi:MAG TPA: S41 family peptidase [Ktedonosporobacter sp.]|jgi:C-terminal processing protease CtpA/Prc|nr:S41 family peptidase [Ktedonosporobacter sp.]
MTPEAMAYLNEALDYIQANAVRRDLINWLDLRQKVFDLVYDAQIPADTYPGIELALKHLNDNHSFFLSPEKEQRRLAGVTKRIGLRSTYPEGVVIVVFSDSPANQAGIRIGDQIVQLNDHPLSTLTRQQFQMMINEEQVDLVLQPKGQQDLRSVHLQAASYDERRSPEGRLIANKVGYLDLPDLPGNLEHKQLYMAETQRLLREIDQAGVSGWVLDLRRNSGGNMWPMLAGIGSLLGEGECLALVSPWEKVPIFYRDGKAYAQERWEKLAEEVKNPYQLQHPLPPVAVLTSSQSTGSSGEFVVLAFRGRPRTRSFGEPTYGVPTGNDLKELSDGAKIFLTSYWGADRTGNVFNGPIPPDHYVKVDWPHFGEKDDPVLQAALQWLWDEESC